MRIEHEVPVRVVRYHTIAEALQSSQTFVQTVRAALQLNRKSEEERELDEFLQAPLWKEYEGEATYERILALVSIDREMGVHEFYQELVERGYYPASISEGFSYVRVLEALKVNVDVVLYLGTFLRTEAFVEKRLLTRMKDDTELIHFSPMTKLKAYYRFVAVREEKKKVKK